MPVSSPLLLSCPQCRRKASGVRDFQKLKFHFSECLRGNFLEADLDIMPLISRGTVLGRHLLGRKGGRRGPGKRHENWLSLKSGLSLSHEESWSGSYSPAITYGKVLFIPISQSLTGTKVAFPRAILRGRANSEPLAVNIHSYRMQDTCQERGKAGRR